MSKYAVVKISGKQYKVQEGDEILVDKLLDLKAQPEVLLTVDGDKVEVGTPTVKGDKVKIKVLEELVKGDKVEVYKFKAKSRYRRHTGFRAQLTKLLVEKI